jgi:excinuclease ABC subunit A
LATELQRLSRGQTLYILDEPTTGLHPSDVKKLIVQLNRLVAAGNTVIVVEHDMDVITQSDWVLDMGPGAGEEGGHIIASGTPPEVAKEKKSKTAYYLRKVFGKI